MSKKTSFELSRRDLLRLGAIGGGLSFLPACTESSNTSTGEQTTLTLHVHIPAAYPDDGVPEWWEYAPNGWRDTVGRLVATLSYLPTENAH